MNVLITYDISNKHPEVKAAMQAEKYKDYWTQDNQTYYLPNTTLWKMANDITPTSVLAEFQKAVADLNANIPVVKDKIKIERCVAVQFTTWQGIPGEKHDQY